MRKVGTLDQASDAQRFASYMGSQAVTCEVREGEGGHDIWVLDEDNMASAAKEFDAFIADKGNAKYRVKIVKPKADDGGFKAIDVKRDVFRRGSSQGVPVVIAMIALSAIASFGGDIVARWLVFSLDPFSRAMPEIASGQVWRLVTPIFVHAGLLHFAFNMLWLYQLGGAMETNEGSRWVLFFTVLTAILAHLAQYYVSGPGFVGFSGVVYAMLGYCWMMSKYKPSAGYALPKETVVFMMIWLVVCMTGLVGNVANTEHVVGMVSGTAIGFLRSGGFKTMRRQKAYRDRFKD